jgi:hypothetical protein
MLASTFSQSDDFDARSKRLAAVSQKKLVETTGIPAFLDSVAVVPVVDDEEYATLSALWDQASTPDVERLSARALARRARAKITAAEPALASAPTQTEGTGSRVSLSRMSRAGLVQRKGFGSRLCSSR